MRSGDTKAVLNSISSQIAVLDADGTIVQVNEAWSAFALDNGGTDALADGVEINYLEVCQSAHGPLADEAPLAVDGIRAVLSGARASFELEYPCHSPAEKRWFLMTVTPFRDALGGAVISHVDVTARKLAEIRRAGFHNIIERSLNEVYIFDADTLRFIEVNESACRNLGYSLDELRSMTPVDIKPEQSMETFAALIKPLQNDGKDKTVFTTAHRRKDGSDYPVEVHLQRMMFDDREVFAAIILDITQRTQTEEALAQARLFLESAPDATLVVDASGEIRASNSQTTRLFGYTPQELQGMPVETLVPERFRDDHPAHRAQFTGNPMVRNMGGDHDLCAVTSTGLNVPVEISLSPIQTGDGMLVVAAIRDVTARKQAEAALLQSKEALALEKERIQVTLESIGDAVITTDAHGRVNYCNAVAEALTGWSRAEARGQLVVDVFHVVHEDTCEPVDDPVARCLSEDTVVNLASHSLLINRNGHEFAIQDSAAPIRDRNGALLGVVLVFSDVSEQRRMTREISHRASHDELTGLLNRREFELRLKRVLETAHTDHSGHALCFLDLDQFKVVNDSCGHAAGDVLLGQVAELFHRHLRERDTLARVGGDEFGLLLEHCGLEQAKRVANALRNAVAEYRFVWEGKPFRIGVSIGVVTINDDSHSIETLMRAADSACYMAKDAGRNRIRIYHEHDAELARRHGEMQWVSLIQQALEDDRFQLYAQLIEHIDPNAEIGLHCEVLLRLVDESGRITLPGVFMPAAERYGLATRIDRWVIDHVFRWLAGQADVVDRLELCSINLSGHSLSDHLLEAHILRQLEATGVPGEKICFEITETAAIANLNDATRFIQTLKTHGLRFALDDFGSGLSSFTYLKNLSVDFLKIDGAFVKDMVDDPIDLAMVRAINEIGQLMGKQTIAECVEDATTRDHLGDIGVDFVQGFEMSRPQPIAGLLKGAGAAAALASAAGRSELEFRKREQ
jgi:diguanylate cyclase (GGDEF)-like protein/PAS domain S-box-containing protein